MHASDQMNSGKEYAKQFSAEVEAQATPFKTVCTLCGLTVSALQTLAGLGLMSVRWPPNLTSAASTMQLLVLDVDLIGLTCLLGSDGFRSYLLSTLVFPAVIAWLVFCHVLSKPLGKLGVSARKVPYTCNTIGLVLQLAFGTMAAVALKPIMCTKHPNGLRRMVSYPSLSCEDSQYGLMLACGMALLFFLVLGFVALCSYATWMMPLWSASGQPQRVQCFRFCTSKYRLDAYWFVVPVCLRHLGFALSVAVGTNMPPAQTALASIVMVIYLITQAAVRPWKVPLMNVVDIAVTAIFVLLLSNSIQVDHQVEMDFAEFCVFVFMLLLVLLWAGFQ